MRVRGCVSVELRSTHTRTHRTHSLQARLSLALQLPNMQATLLPLSPPSPPLTHLYVNSRMMRKTAPPTTAPTMAPVRRAAASCASTAEAAGAPNWNTEEKSGEIATEPGNTGTPAANSLAHNSVLHPAVAEVGDCARRYTTSCGLRVRIDSDTAVSAVPDATLVVSCCCCCCSRARLEEVAVFSVMVAFH